MEVPAKPARPAEVAAGRFREDLYYRHEATGWRVSGPKGAAKILGLNLSTLRFRMKKLEIERGAARPS